MFARPRRPQAAPWMVPAAWQPQRRTKLPSGPLWLPRPSRPPAGESLVHYCPKASHPLQPGRSPKLLLCRQCLLTGSLTVRWQFGAHGHSTSISGIAIPCRLHETQARYFSMRQQEKEGHGDLHIHWGSHRTESASTPHAHRFAEMHPLLSSPSSDRPVQPLAMR